MELMPGSNVKVQASTIALARSKHSPGSCIAYLMKRIYSLERLWLFTLSYRSDYEHLPKHETDAIKGKIISIFLLITRHNENLGSLFLLSGSFVPVSQMTYRSHMLFDVTR